MLRTRCRSGGRPPLLRRAPPPVRSTAPSALPAREVHFPVQPGPWTEVQKSGCTSSRGSTPASVRLRRFPRPWRFAPSRALWGVSPTHTHGVGSPCSPLDCPFRSGPKTGPVRHGGRDGSRQAPGWPAANRLSPVPPRSPLWPSKRSVRLRLPLCLHSDHRSPGSLRRLSSDDLARPGCPGRAAAMANHLGPVGVWPQRVASAAPCRPRTSVSRCKGPGPVGNGPLRARDAPRVGSTLVAPASDDF